jgi:FtsH-binding integral membrane protein
MPVKIKIVLSFVVAAVAIAGYFFQQDLGKVPQSYAALAIGVIAVGGMWVFPEVSHKKEK